MWVLDPGDPVFPGSPLTDLLGVDPAAVDLLVEAPGPVALLTGLPDGVRLPEQARQVEDVVVLAQDAEAVAADLARDEPVDPPLQDLAATRAPLAWAGATPLGPTLVTLDGDALRVEVAAEVAEQVSAGLDGSLPGSPGRRWRDLLTRAEVVQEGDRTVLTARVTDALPPTLLRQLVDQAALPPR